MSGIYFLNGYLRPASERDPLRTVLRQALKEIHVDPDDPKVRYYSQNVSTAIPGDVIADTDIDIYLGIFENGELQKIYELEHDELKTALKEKLEKLQKKINGISRDELKEYKLNPPKELLDGLEHKNPIWQKKEDK